MAEPLTKGTALVELVKLARTQRDAFDPLLPPETRALVDSRILAGSWYPEVHLQRLLVAADRVLGQGDLGLCRSLGRTAARRTLQSLYKTALVPGDVVASLRLLTLTWSFMHDTGTVTVHVPSDDVVRLTIRDFAAPSPAVCAVFSGWIEGKVEMAGGRASVTEEICRLRGGDACVYAAHWALATGPGADVQT